jgi:hypothetical protein
MKARWCAILLGWSANAGAGVVEIGNDKELLDVLAKLEAGTTLKIAEDEPQKSRPTLPGVVVEEVHGQDPKLDRDTRLPRDPAALRMLGR